MVVPAPKGLGTGGKGLRVGHGGAQLGKERFDGGLASCGFAVLDHARSRSPYRTDWNWGAAVGAVDGRRIGINLGGGGPDALRNGLSHTVVTVDGRIHTIPTALRWQFDPSDWMRPWRMSTDRVELTFTPFFDRIARTNLFIIRSSTHQCFGSFAGRIQTDDGEWITVDGLEGWAEDVHNRW